MVGSGLRWTLDWRSGLRVQCDRLSFTEARPEELTPHAMVRLAQHLARHRLREPQLLEAIAHFLVVQEAQLSTKVGLPPVLPRHRQAQPLSSLIGCRVPQRTPQPGPIPRFPSSLASPPARAVLQALSTVLTSLTPLL